MSNEDLKTKIHEIPSYPFVALKDFEELRAKYNMVVDTLEKYKGISIQVQTRTPTSNIDAQFGPPVFKSVYEAAIILDRIRATATPAGDVK